MSEQVQDDITKEVSKEGNQTQSESKKTKAAKRSAKANREPNTNDEQQRKRNKNANTMQTKPQHPPKPQQPTDLPPTALYHPLPDKIRQYYRAAGVIPYCRTTTHGVGSCLVLLGREKRQGKVGWSEFGGKVESSDSCVEDTALREFMEESGGLYSDTPDILKTLKEVQTRKIWNASGKYVIFLLEVPHKFIEQDSKLDGKTEMRWFHAEDFLRCTNRGAKLEGNAGLSDFFRMMVCRKEVSAMLSGLLLQNGS